MPRTPREISPASKVALRFLAAHGRSTRTTLAQQIACANLPISAAQIQTTINSLCTRGLIDLDASTKPGLLQITALGRARIGDANSYSGTVRTPILDAPRYQPRALTAPTRPGAMDAYALPSRMGDDLHFPALHSADAMLGHSA
ncbi:hypothetical protein P3G55_21910 [Leptospira sp. 96542]|nr:hypothetical protein [Leptospira sp. 96542]